MFLTALTRGELEAIAVRLQEIQSMLGQVTVADVCDLTGQGQNAHASIFGWKDLPSSIKIHELYDGFLLDLPRPEPLFD
jgi:hypothetical protein